MNIIVYVIIFASGFAIGYFLKQWFVRRSKSSGIIYVSHEEEKTLYSLELEDYPESIEFKKKVVFKVKALEEPLNRE
jgi:hypothetical protein